MELLVERFMLKYSNVFEGKNLVQMRLTGPLEVYVCNSDAQINATPKVDKFDEKCTFLGGV